MVLYHDGLFSYHDNRLMRLLFDKCILRFVIMKICPIFVRFCTISREVHSPLLCKFSSNRKKSRAFLRYLDASNDCEFIINDGSERQCLVLLFVF